MNLDRQALAIEGDASGQRVVQAVQNLYFPTGHAYSESQSMVLIGLWNNIATGYDYKYTPHTSTPPTDTSFDLVDNYGLLLGQHCLAGDGRNSLHKVFA